jgi:uncharacterized protein YndB with AHSA1/START domain
MVPDRIERDILIEAPAEVVWRVVTDPGQLQRWYCDAAEIDLRPGGEGVLTFTNRATNRAATVPISVVSVEPPRTFSYRWSHSAGEEARPDNSTLVEFSLTPEGQGTRLRVVESGLDLVNWPAHHKATYADDHIKGWEIHLGNLREFVSREHHASAPR